MPGEAEPGAERQVPLRLDLGAAGKLGREPIDLPAVAVRLGHDLNVPDRGVAGDDRRQLDARLAGHRRDGDEVADPMEDRQAPCRRERRCGSASLTPGASLAVGAGVPVDAVDIDLLAAGREHEIRLVPGVDRRVAGDDIRIGRRADLQAIVGNGHAGIVEREPAGRPRHGGLLAATGALGPAVSGNRRQVEDLQRELAAVVRLVADEVGVALCLDRHRFPVRQQTCPEPHLPVGVDGSGRKGKGSGMVVDGARAFDVPRAGQAVGGKAGIEIADFLGPVVLLVDEVDGALGNLDVLQDHRPRRQVVAVAQGPVEGPVVEQTDGAPRPVDAHVEDEDLSAQERSELRVHREVGDRHHRRAGLGVHDAHVAEGDRRERQQSSLGGAQDLHPLSENATRLPFEILAITGPVDEIGTDQRREQQQDDYTPDDDKQAGQRSSPPNLPQAHVL